MTNEEVKKSLQKLYQCGTDFTVIQSGKKSSRVNGCYKPGTQEIILHNKNFNSDNALVYTAIHEFTHHVLTTEKGVKNVKCHSGIFWSAFYDFIDIAIEKGIYKRERSDATKALIGEAKRIQKEIIDAQKRLGRILAELHKVCAENGDRLEDVIESDLQLSRAKAKELETMVGSDTEFSDEMTKVVATAKDMMLAKQAAENGKTVEQVKAVAKQKPKATDDDIENPQMLLKEKKRLERTIGQLQDRLVQVEETLRSMQGE